LEDNCVYEIDGSIYNLNPLKDNKGNYNVSIAGGEESLNTYKVIFNMCKELETPSIYNCSADTRAALINIDPVENITTCYPLADNSSSRTYKLVEPRTNTDLGLNIS
jgi:hypothetical protein